MINGVVIREQDTFTDYRGDNYTNWKDGDFVESGLQES